MAIYDYFGKFSTLQSLIGGAGATNSEDGVNFGTADPNIGAGAPQWLYVMIGTAVASAGAATLKATVEHSDDGVTYTTLFDGATHAKTVCVADFLIIEQPLPATNKQYVRIVYTVGVAALTAGTVSAWLGGAP